MGNSSHEKQTNYVPEIIVALGYILLFCLAPLTFLGLYYYTTPKNVADETEFAFATNLPPSTPISLLPTDFITGENNIFREEFNDNQNSWRDNQEPYAFEIKDGKLFIESQNQNQYALASCSSINCNWLNQPFYLQVELSTQDLYTKTYGVLFKMNYARDKFILFAINSDLKEYYLYNHNTNGWSIKLAGNIDEIQAYPSSNILAIYVDKTYIELYINGNFIDTYQDTGTSFQSGQFGVFIDNGGVLIIDNLIIDKEEGQ